MSPVALWCIWTGDTEEEKMAVRESSLVSSGAPFTGVGVDLQLWFSPHADIL